MVPLLSRRTRRESLVCRLLGLAIVLLALWRIPAFAQSPHHAALVVDFGDGRVLVRVVAFAEDTITGVDLLRRSGLDVAIMENLGGGAALCAVEGVGCPPTPQDCFCQCRGGACRYWSYFHLQGGAWVYSGTGAAGRALRDGDVDGWVWGDGRAAPPLLTWDEIWAAAGAPSPSPTATLLPTTAPPTVPPPTAPPPTETPPLAAATLPASASPAAPLPTRTRLPSPTPPPATELPELSPTATAAAEISPRPVMTPAAPAGAAGERPFPWTALAFGGLVAVFLALALWVRRRR